MRRERDTLREGGPVAGCRPFLGPRDCRSVTEGVALEFFRQNGFTRRRCPACGSHFWTQGDHQRCGDAPCVEYSFLGAPLFAQPMGLAEMREAFLGFFARHGHAWVARAPVVARWRDDIYLTIASIAVFQPHVTSGLAEPPANPLAISQPCIRLNDLASVGRSGRHLTTFEMMGHHAFNDDEHDIYWQERTVELCHTLYAELGVPGAALTYKENPWSGGGNAGAALEVLAGGLELATLVFMDLEADPAGDVELKGERFRRMSRSIVDTGYGLERMVWASQGTPTIYEAAFPGAVKLLTEAAGLGATLARAEALIAENARVCGLLAIDYGADLHELREQVLARLREAGHELTLDELTATIAPLERVFAVADHARTLAFMLGDGIVPGNVRAGYLVRMVLRRTLLLLRELELPDALPQVVAHHLDTLAADFPALAARRDHIQTVLAIERERFDATLDRGRRIVARAVAAGPLDADALVELYDSHGLPPAVVQEFAAAEGAEVAVPDGFLARVAERHAGEQRAAAAAEAPPPDVASIEPLYHTRPGESAFDAEVLHAADGEVALSATQFYPEGGGQPADHGTLTWDGGGAKVMAVRSVGDVVLHALEGGLPPVGAAVHGTIDRARRLALMRHHTATHLVGAAARRLLGDHVWQSGAQKGTDRARLDISHYRRLDHAALSDIEREANALVLADLPVRTHTLPLAEADARFGNVLYQGGAPKHPVLRVVEIADGESIVDVQMCGGTHCARTGQVGSIRLLRSERIQDGIERLEFAAGAAAVETSLAERALLDAATEALSTPRDRVAHAAARTAGEAKEARSRIAALERELAATRSDELRPERIGSVDVYINESAAANPAELQNLARELTAAPGRLALLGCRVGDRGHLMAARAADVAVDCSALLREAARAVGGGGGGAPTHAQGMVPDDRVGEALAAMAAAARAALG